MCIFYNSLERVLNVASLPKELERTKERSKAKHTFRVRCKLLFLYHDVGACRKNVACNTHQKLFNAWFFLLTSGKVDVLPML